MIPILKDIKILYLRTDKRLKEEMLERSYRVSLTKRVARLEHELRMLKNSKRCQ